MTRYKLPDALGGGEVEGRVIRTGAAVGIPHPVLLATIEGVGEGSVPLAALTEVKPPLPPEPPDCSVVVASGQLFQRQDDDDDDDHWWIPGSAYGRTWAEVCATGAPVRLIPEPEPVTLPWSHTDEDGDHVSAVAHAGKVRVRMRTRGLEAVDLSPDACREMARALWTAARQS